jgi:hypothetical protein
MGGFVKTMFGRFSLAVASSAHLQFSFSRAAFSFSLSNEVHEK